MRREISRASKPPKAPRSTAARERLIPRTLPARQPPLSHYRRRRHTRRVHPHWQTALRFHPHRNSIECASNPNPRYGARSQYLRLCRDWCSTPLAKFDISYCTNPFSSRNSHASSYNSAASSSLATAGACSRAPPPSTSRPSRDPSSISSRYTLRCVNSELHAASSDVLQLSRV